MTTSCVRCHSSFEYDGLYVTTEVESSIYCPQCIKQSANWPMYFLLAGIAVLVFGLLWMRKTDAQNIEGLRDTIIGFETPDNNGKYIQVTLSQSGDGQWYEVHEYMGPLGAGYQIILYNNDTTILSSEGFGPESADRTFVPFIHPDVVSSTE